MYVFQSYMMRNSVFGVLGEMIIRVLSKDNLDDKDKKTREQFMDKLEVRMCNTYILYRTQALHA